MQTLLLGIIVGLFFTIISVIVLIKMNIIHLRKKTKISPSLDDNTQQKSQIKTDEITLIINKIESTLDQLSYLADEKSLSLDTINNLKEISLSNICLFNTTSSHHELETNNINIIYPSTNTNTYQKIINIILSAPILHNKLCTFEDIAKTSNAASLLNNIKNINIPRIKSIYLNVKTNKANNTLQGCIFINNYSKKDKDRELSKLRLQISVLLADLYIENHITHKQHHEIDRLNQKNETASRLLKEVIHDGTHAITLQNHITQNIAKEKNYITRQKLVKRMSSASFILSNNIDKLNWLYQSSLQFSNRLSVINETQWINIIYWAKKLYEAFIGHAKTKKISFILIIENNLPDNIKANEKAISQIIFNYLSNAFKYTEKGFVILSLSGHKNIDKTWQLVISVQDSGHGIKKENQPHIFTRQFREHLHLSGTGIGLSICKTASDLIQGQLSFISEKDKGSTFILSFNSWASHIENESDNTNTTSSDIFLSNDSKIKDFTRKNEDFNIVEYDEKLITILKELTNILILNLLNQDTCLHVQIVTIQSNNESIKSRYTDSEVIYKPNQQSWIALVDDNSEILEYWDILLVKMGFNTKTFENSNSAFEAIKKREIKFDLLISDYNLENHTTGVALIKRLRENDIVIPAILMTAEDIEQVSDEAYAAGVNKILSKSINIESLSYEIKEILSNEGFEFSAHLNSKKDNLFTLDNTKYKSKVFNQDLTEKTTEDQFITVELDKYLSIIAKTASNLGDPTNVKTNIHTRMSNIDALIKENDTQELYYQLHNLKNLAIMLKMPASLLIMKLQTKDIKEKTSLSDELIQSICDACDEFMIQYTQLYSHIKKKGLLTGRPL